MKLISNVQNALLKSKYCKVDLNEKPSKILEKKQVPYAFRCLKSSTREIRSVSSTVTIPPDAKNSSPLRFDIDTNVDIITTTSRATLTYILPRVNACVLFLVVIALVATKTWADQVVALQANIDQVYQDLSVLTQDCHRMRLTLDEVVQRYDESRVQHAVKHNVKHFVEREATSMASYDDGDGAVTERSNDTQILAGGNERKDTDQSNVPIPENVQSRQPKLVKYNSDDYKMMKNMMPVKFVNSTDDKNSEFVEDRKFVDGDYSIEADYEDSELSSNQRTGREKRSNGREVLAAHFKGAFPETVIRDGGSVVAPWFLDESASGPFGLSRFNLREGKGAVQVTEAGLYYIYAQVYYLSNETLNSFWINSRQTDKSVSHLALCSTIAWSDNPGELSEVSCYTSAVRYLKSNETVFLQQRERNRRILMRDGQTFLGLVRLHGQHQKAVVRS